MIDLKYPSERAQSSDSSNTAIQNESKKGTVLENNNTFVKNDNIYNYEKKYNNLVENSREKLNGKMSEWEMYQEMNILDIKRILWIGGEKIHQNFKIYQLLQEVTCQFQQPHIQLRDYSHQLISYAIIKEQEFYHII